MSNTTYNFDETFDFKTALSGHLETLKPLLVKWMKLLLANENNFYWSVEAVAQTLLLRFGYNSSEWGVWVSAKDKELDSVSEVNETSVFNELLDASDLSVKSGELIAFYEAAYAYLQENGKYEQLDAVFELMPKWFVEGWAMATGGSEAIPAYVQEWDERFYHRLTDGKLIDPVNLMPDEDDDDEDEEEEE